ncbi:MAG: hypothetical protein LC104_19610 [Bacteroidales bacterium]|nr:hypothetical protein [Bacteroidales bacterium]
MEERPVDNAPYLVHNHGALTIEGYSRAAVQSYWRVPELKVGFDLGAHPWEFTNIPNWLISHTHLDHITALPALVARRRMFKMEPPRIFVPAEAVEDVRKLLLIMQRLDRGRQTCELIGMEAGAEYELSREHIVTAWATVHTIPSRGYIIWDRRHKLKEEYHGLPGNTIRDLRLSGTPVTREVRVPLVAYTGDTAPAGLDACPDVYKAKVLITELSFVRAAHRPEKVHKFGHIHLDDILERAARFENELVIVGHLSTRYHPSEVWKTFDRKVPQALKEKLRLWL